jgi:hypothetical protein
MQVVNKHIEEQRFQDRSVRNTGENFKRWGRNIRKTDVRMSVV